MPNSASKLSRMSEKFWLVLFFSGGRGWWVIVTNIFNQSNFNNLSSLWWTTQGNPFKMPALKKFSYIRIRKNLVPNCSLQWTHVVLSVHFPLKRISCCTGKKISQCIKFFIYLIQFCIRILKNFPLVQFVTNI